MSDINQKDEFGFVPEEQPQDDFGFVAESSSASSVPAASQEEEKGFLDKALEGYEKYGAAPMRAGMQAIQKSALEKGKPLDAVAGVKAAYDQFGEDPSKAPSVQQLVDENPIGRALKSEPVKNFTEHAFKSHPALMSLNAIFGKETVRELPGQAAEMAASMSTDPLSYVPGKVFAKPAGMLLKKAEPVLVPLSNKASELAHYLAKKAVIKHLSPTAKAKQLLGSKGLDDVAEEVLASDAMKPFSSAEETGIALDDLRQEVGAKIGDIVNSSTGKIDPVQVAERMRKEVLDPLKGNSEAINSGLVADLEKQIGTFLDTYAPGYTPGGRAPGSPTVIRRHSEFIPQEPVKTQVEVGMYPANNAPNPSKIIGQDPYTGAPKYADTVGASAEISAPVPQGPVKQVVETRLEGVPRAGMTPRQSEDLKTTMYDNINWKNDTNLKNAKKQDLARIVKEEGEKAINDLDFLAAKKSYGNLAAAQEMAERTGSLKEGGLFQKMADTGTSVATLYDLAQGKAGMVPFKAAQAASKGRIASTVGASMEGLSKILKNNPEIFGKHAQKLQEAAAKGPQALAVTSYLLGLKDPNYRQTVESLDKEPIE